ncbi:hypothetical protein FRB91_011427 [Serendipita sp. 411]|nr:hypothetical protein FRC18_002935 [Serendipita sp. 400]KAG8847779.1 hypothetical protein FRB91_011427 [Serendipita sp. 411]
MPVGPSHYFIRKVASMALTGFFREVHVIGEENVPKEGPVIVCCTHHNMMIDPAVLSSTVAYGRPLHYWAKASLFKNPIARKILLASGVIPVDRGSHDNQKLFAGTFEALAHGDAVALFPEGTSYTLPRIVQVKDGASWSALEYLKWIHQGGKNTNKGQELVVVPAGITYTDKSKYRSSAVIEYGPPIHLTDLKQNFLSDSEAETRAAVKSLTHAIEKAMIELTVNAPNWEALLAARTARDLLFESWRGVPLDSFKDVYQTLVDAFSTPWDSDPEFVSLKRSLITYHSLLKSTHLTNGELSHLPLSKSRKSSSEPVPPRLSTILPLLRESIAVLIRLPLFLVPLMINVPIYWMTRWVGEKAAVDEESVAQSKIVVGLVLFLVIHSFWFWVIWIFLAITPIGALIAAVSVWALATYHRRLIDDNYIRAKRLLSAYRVLVGVWGPQRWDLSLSTLTQYTTTQPPPENPFLKLPDSVKKALVRSSSSPIAPTLSTTGAAAAVSDAPTSAPKIKRSQRPPSRKLIRHLLRARADAIRRLAAFIRKIDDPSVRVCASGFMAKTFNPDPNGALQSLFDQAPGGTNAIQTVSGGVEAELNPTGWRSGKEVIAYLRSKGAHVGRILREGEGGEQAFQWDAVSSEGELSSPGSPDDQIRIKQEEVEWVVPGSK